MIATRNYKVGFHPELGKDPDLPKHIKGARIFIEVDWGVTKSDGLPRDIRDLVGKVHYAQWTGDDRIEVLIDFGRFPSGDHPVKPLLDKGLARLTWDGKHVLVIPS